MGGSLGALPTENLLQMIGNLRLSTRLLLENSETKDYFLLTFREGELVPEIESSSYPTLEKVLMKDINVDQTQITELSAAQADLPFWNRLMVAGLVDRKKMRSYLVDGIRSTLNLFRNLSGVHFELSPIPTERLGTLTGYSVTEIVSLARKPDSIPSPSPRPEPEMKTEQPITASTATPVKPGPPPKVADSKPVAPSKPAETKPTVKKIQPATARIEEEAKPESSTEDFKKVITELLRQLHQIVPGVHACYILDCEKADAIASSSSLKLKDRPDFREIADIVCSRSKNQSSALRVERSYLVTDKYLIGSYFLTATSSLLAICRRQTQFGLLLTGLRRVGQRVIELFKGRS
ncbi:hypothetical protein JXM67_09440 [candidate division WOR-3 bacterium]|nr:hypothetical protein [candidate division WOR-3 bacterium]